MAKIFYIFSMLFSLSVMGMGYKSSAKMFFAQLKSIDEKVAIEACEEGSADSCIVVAFKYQMDARDELAIDFLNLACNEYHDKRGCLLLGGFYQGLNDYQLALEHFQKSCDLGSGTACFELIFLKIERICGDHKSCVIFDFTSVPQKRNEYRILLRKACQLGEGRACQVLR